MSAEHILTVGNAKQIGDSLNGRHLKGRDETRMAIVGRSNVGKSSLINSLLDTRLAQVSASPGKTRLIHFYYWNEARKIVADLPGYGFARASGSEQEAWAKLIAAYLGADENLERALVLLDSRHGPTANDRQAIEFLSSKGIPVTFVFTKSDALKTQSERVLRRREAAAALGELGFRQEAHWVSSRTGAGLKELARALRETEAGELRS